MANRYFLNIGVNWNDLANWSTSSGGAGGASVPGSGDVAIFDANSGNCTLNANVNVSGMDIYSSYTNTVTQGAGKTVTTGTADFQLKGGSFIGGDSNITCNDRFIVSATCTGFTATSAILKVINAVDIASGKYTHNNGTFFFNNFFSTTLKCNGNTFYDFKFDVGTSTITTFTGDVIVLNLLDFVEGGGTHNGSGNFRIRKDCKTVSPDGNFRPFYFDGTGAQELNANGGSGGTGNLHFTNLTGTITVKDTIEVYSNITVSSGADVDFTTNSSEIKLVGGTTSITMNGVELHDLTFNSFSIYATNNGTTVVKGNLKLSSLNQCNSGSFHVHGDYTSSDGGVTGNTSVHFVGTGDQYLSGSDFLDGSIVVNKPSGSLKLLSNETLVNQDMVIEQGIFDIEAYNFSGGDDLTINGGSVTSTTGILTFERYFLNDGTLDPFKAISSTSSNSTLFTDSATFNLMPSGGDFEFKGSNHWSINQNYTVFPHLILNKCSTCGQGGQFYADKVTNTTNKIGTGFIRGDLISNGFNAGGASGTQTFDGIGDQNIIGEMTFYRLEFNKTTGTVLFQNDFRLSQCEIVAGADKIDFGTSRCHILATGSHLSSSDWKVLGLKFYQIELEIASTGNAVMNTTEFSNKFIITQCGSLDGTLTGQGDVESNDSSVSGGIQLTLNGTLDQTILLSNPGSSGFQNSIFVDKESGQVKQLSDVGSSSTDITLINGVWCTNEFDCDADELAIDSDSDFRKTPSSTVTATTLIGIVQDVTGCQKKTSFLNLV